MKDDLITLREARLNAGLSQTEAAELSNIPQTTLSHYEKDMCKPSTARFKNCVISTGIQPTTFVIQKINEEKKWSRRNQKHL